MGALKASGAEVAKRQTQWTQNPPWVTTWGFKSPPRHSNEVKGFLRILRICQH